MLDSQMSLLLGAVGAYVLLRVDELKGLRDWIENLRDTSALLPDIHILHAELMARLGEHEVAIASLELALDGGCPWLRSGVAYLADRVRQYLAINDSKADEFSLPSPGKFRKGRERLERQLTWLVPGAILTTFDVPLVEGGSRLG